MNRKTLIQATVLALSVTFAMGAAAQTAAPAKAKVVIQVSDGDAARWNMALNNAKNVQDELGASNVDIEIVAYGPGIGMLKADAILSNRIIEATTAGVQVIACENTMTVQKIIKADMNPAIGYVRAGVVQLMNRQREGWAYIRP